LENRDIGNLSLTNFWKIETISHTKYWKIAISGPFHLLNFGKSRPFHLLNFGKSRPFHILNIGKSGPFDIPFFETVPLSHAFHFVSCTNSFLSSYIYRVLSHWIFPLNLKFDSNIFFAFLDPYWLNVLSTASLTTVVLRVVNIWRHIWQ